MGISATVEEILKSEAEFGLFKATFSIGKKKAISLREKGLIVDDSKDSKNFPRLHRMSWENAKVGYEDVKALDEDSDEYTLAEKLWIIAMKNQPKK